MHRNAHQLCVKIVHFCVGFSSGRLRFSCPAIRFGCNLKLRVRDVLKLTGGHSKHGSLQRCCCFYGEAFVLHDFPGLLKVLKWRVCCNEVKSTSHSTVVSLPKRSFGKRGNRRFCSAGLMAILWPPWINFMCRHEHLLNLRLHALNQGSTCCS